MVVEVGSFCRQGLSPKGEPVGNSLRIAACIVLWHAQRSRHAAREQSGSNTLFLLRREITTRNVSEGFLCKAPIPRLRVLKLCICDYPKPTRQRGIVFRGLRRVAGNPSLTLRVVINPRFSPQVNNLSAETRNFKTDASVCDKSFYFRPLISGSL